MIAELVTFLVSLAQAQKSDLTPIIVGIIAAISSAGGTAWLTVKRTNKKLEAESELIYQQALELADKRAAQNVDTMERITKTLSDRLDVTEEALEAARQKLSLAEAKILELEQRASAIASEKDRAIMAAQYERDSLQRRILELEERYADLVAALPGRRRRDPHGNVIIEETPKKE